MYIYIYIYICICIPILYNPLYIPKIQNDLSVKIQEH